MKRNGWSQNKNEKLGKYICANDLTFGEESNNVSPAQQS